MPDRDTSLRRNVAPTRMLAVRDGRWSECPDSLATEEPLEIRAGGPGQDPVSVAVTMRTPGHDFELAVGFLHTEGLIAGHDDVASVAYCEVPDGEQRYNVVTVGLRRAFDAAGMRRNFYATSSCGVCGKASLDQVEVRCDRLAPGPTISTSAILRMPQDLRRAQLLFERTGGLHGAALFDPGGRVVAVREDVGRHNAVDKLIGQGVLAGDLPLSERVLLVSGRASFEIVQKAAVAGIPVVCAVSAPSSLAVEAAERFGMTLVGFLRDRAFNVYSHGERIERSARVRDS
ncbi:MAG: formate dehydrogenase accessory sulfurtransferase FdhD [Actinobacteria bacterium]|nr:formate dehydrogenase accessory sulfurtransferase FdhD [Actinomycetota bacterium]